MAYKKRNRLAGIDLGIVSIAAVKTMTRRLWSFFMR